MRHIILIAALGAALGLLALGGTASAAAPETVRIEFDQAGESLDCGAYTLERHVVGHVISRVFVQDGQLVRTLENVAVRNTWTNPDTGESISSPDAGANLFVIDFGTGATLAISGVLLRVVVPGQGIVAGQVGHETLFFTGPDDMVPDITIHGIHDEDILEALCAALAPPA